MASNGQSDDHFSEDIHIPDTLTPWLSVILGNILVFGLVWLVGAFLLTPFLDDNIKWSGVGAIAIFGLLVVSGGNAVDIPDWYGVLVFNPFTKNRRVMFPGFHWKNVWEKLEMPLSSMKREISGKVVANFATNDPAERMDVEILIHMRLDTRPKPPEQDARNFKRFVSIEEHALTELLEARTLNMFGEYFGSKEMEELLKLHEVQEAVLAIPDNHKVFHGLEREYGGHIGIELRKSEPDAATREMKRTPARAEALRSAIKKLMEPHTDPSGAMVPGLSTEEARRAALLLDDTAEYTEDRTDWHINVDAPDLKNLQNVSVVGVPANTGGKKGAKK